MRHLIPKPYAPYAYRCHGGIPTTSRTTSSNICICGISSIMMSSQITKPPRNQSLRGSWRSLPEKRAPAAETKSRIQHSFSIPMCPHRVNGQLCLPRAQSFDLTRHVRSATTLNFVIPISTQTRYVWSIQSLEDRPNGVPSSWASRFKQFFRCLTL